MTRALVGFVVDACLVVLFATLGRVSHAEGVTTAGVAGVAWPFLVALAVGWAVVRVRTGGWPARMPGSTTVWLLTAVLGLLLRVATGGGFAWAFGVVAVLVLGLFLVGWRCAVEVTRFAVDALRQWSERAARDRVRRERRAR